MRLFEESSGRNQEEKHVENRLGREERGILPQDAEKVLKGSEQMPKSHSLYTICQTYATVFLYFSVSLGLETTF